MTDSRALVSRVMAANKALVDALNLIRQMKDQIDQLPTALDEDLDWTQSFPKTSKGDIIGAVDGWTQVLFAFDSGAPTQKSKIYGILT